MHQNDVVIRYEAGEWVVRAAAESEGGERFATLEAAQAAAHQRALPRAPCWVRLYSEPGWFRMAYHLR